MRILHVFRKPIGGLFRHAVDLAREQAAQGHDVGLIFDSDTGGSGTERALADLAPRLSLGVKRVPIGNFPGPNDISALRAVTEYARTKNADVLHGHGAKGGVYARLAARHVGIPGFYTPHGGSMYYNWHKPPGMFFLAAEQALRLKRTGLIFVCEFERDIYKQKIGLGSCPYRVIYNGLGSEDFVPRVLQDDATDLVFLGEMHIRKGIDLLLKAMAQLRPQHLLTATLAGEGQDMEKFKVLSKTLGIEHQVKFVGHKTMAQALQMGRLLVIPSRNESFPYVVLEALAANAPVIASSVGGIPEALPKENQFLPDDVGSLANRIGSVQSSFADYARKSSELRQIAQQKYSAETMTKQILSFYQELR